VGLLDPDLAGIDLLAERVEEAEGRRRDPARRARWLVAAAVVGMGIWGGWLGFQIWSAEAQGREADEQLRLLQKGAGHPVVDAQEASAMEWLTTDLNVHGSQRFLFANVLNALQYLDLPEIQFYRLQIDRVVTRVEPPRRRSRRVMGVDPPEEKTQVLEHFVVRIQGKNYGDEAQIELMIRSLQTHRQFSRWLDPARPIQLTEIVDRQVDPSDPSRGFARFGIECRLKERVFVYE
jgi:hypothetical protein